MSRRVVLTDRATGELEAAYLWYVEHAPHFAARWYNGFIDELQSLSEDAERFPPALESGRFPVRIWQLLYGLGRKTHRAIFTIRDDVIIVLRIRHAAQAPLTDID